MATVYSSTQSYGVMKFRAGCTYTVTNVSNTVSKISGTVFLQHISTVPKPVSLSSNIYGFIGYNSTTTVSATSGGQKEFLTAHTSWVTVKSASFSFNSWERNTTARSLTFYVGLTNYTASGHAPIIATKFTITIPARPSYTISYNAAGGSSTPSSQTQYYGIDVTLRGAISKPGYTFNGWYSSATKKTYAAGAIHQPNQNTTMTAQWIVNKAIIKYNANGGTQGNNTYSSNMKPMSGYSHIVNYNSKINLVDIKSFDLTKANYHIIATSAWNTNAAGTGASYSQSADYNWTTFGNTAAETKTTTLYAKWVPDTYNVVFNANDGSGAPSKQIKTYGKTLTLSAIKPTRSGYSFYHWCKNKNNTGTTWNAGSSFTENGNSNEATITLYAIWNPIISYNLNGGSNGPASQVKAIDNNNFKISSVVPTRSGYVFEKWKGSDNNNYEPNDSYSSNTPLTLTAQWQKLPNRPQISEETVVRSNVFLTEDTTVNPQKKYYHKTSLYDEVSNPSGNPQSEGWYIIVNNEYQLTEDTVVDSQKTYYSFSHYEYDLVIPEQDPHANGLYEAKDDDEGAFAIFKVVWSIDMQNDVDNPVYPPNSDPNSGEVVGSCEIKNPTQGDTNPNFHFTGDTTGSGGTAIAVLEVDTEKQYKVTVTVSDRASNSPYNLPSTYKEDSLTAAIFVMDFRAGGKAIGIGRAAPESGLGIAYKTIIENNTVDEPLIIVNDGSNIPATGAFIKTIRTDTNKDAYFGVGSGGQNRGIYLEDINKWLIKENGNSATIDLPVTIDGNLTVSDGNITTKINWNGTTTGSNIWRSFLVNDKETTPVTVGQFTAGRRTTYTQAFIQTRNPKLSSDNTNALGVTVNDNGTLGYTISSPAAFRSALSISDCVTSSGSGTASNATWTWRKWASGKIEAWCSYAPSSAVATTVWVSPIRYKDLTISIPSGVFSSTPGRVYGTSFNNQLWVVDAIGASATSLNCRFATLSSNNVMPNIRFYCTN